MPSENGEEGARNSSLILTLLGQRAGMSLYGASTPVLEVGCSRRISLFKYIYSLQGCNYFDISVSASQSHNAELVMQQPLPER